METVAHTGVPFCVIFIDEILLIKKLLREKELIVKVPSKQPGLGTVNKVLVIALINEILKGIITFGFWTLFNSIEAHVLLRPTIDNVEEQVK